MKILSNFDTSLYDTIKAEYVAQYGPENVMVVRRASVFFWLYIIVPLVCMFLIFSCMMWFAFGGIIVNEVWDSIVQITSLTIGIIMLFTWGGTILKKYFDYTMDFCIITPKELVSYNQSGIFNRRTEVIDAEKIKTINKVPKGLYGSLFNFASIIFLSEGDKDMGDITLHYVENPEQTYKDIRQIIEPHFNQQAGEEIFVK